MKCIPTDLNCFKLPVSVTYDEDYYSDLKQSLQKYEDYIKNKVNISDENKKKVSNNISQIILSLEEYYNANISSAYNRIKLLLHQYINSPYIVAPIDENYAFRGIAPINIRPSEYKNNPIYQPMYEKMLSYPLSFFKARVAAEDIKSRDMLHIPFSMRGIVSTQRFSIAGVPCLYLSTSSFGSWIEMGMPQEDIFQVSSFKIPNKLKVLNLCIQQNTINGASGYIEDEEERNLCDLLELFPLVIATSYRVREMERSFKSEYIISQLVMQAANELNIDGIAYLSKRTEDVMAYPQAVNLAILMSCDDINNRKYWRRSTEIAMTDPYRMSEFYNICGKEEMKKHIIKKNYLSYVSEIYKKNVSGSILLAGNEMNYIKSKFSAFDDFMLGQEFKIFDGQ